MTAFVILVLYLAVDFVLFCMLRGSKNREVAEREAIYNHAFRK
ncbi:Uncharacterised protein [uncultured archaeon]|nr:Uncharacterised protein [uncultured archaeon]